MPDQYELVDNLVAYDRPWKTLPVEDIKVKEGGDGAIDGATHAVLGECAESKCSVIPSYKPYISLKV